MELKIDSMELKVLTDDELQKINSIATEILETRYNQKKEKAWLAVRNAIADYCKEYGCIDICEEYDNLTIDSTNDFSTIGEIHFKEF